jgi:hypothetical protein
LLDEFPGRYDPFTCRTPIEQGTLISFDVPIRTLIKKGSFLWRIIDRNIPLSVPFCMVMTIYVIKKKQLKKHFPLMVLLPTMIVQSFFDTEIQKRIIVTIIPLFLLTCCQLFSTFWNWIKVGIEKEKSYKKFITIRAKQVIIAISIFSIVSVPFIIDKYVFYQRDLPKYLYNPLYDYRSKINPEPAYMYVRKYLKRNEIVLHTTLEYGLFFLGDEFNHYYLRQQRDFDINKNIKFTSFSKKIDPYYERPIIDSIKSLKKLMNDSNSKIWLILGVKSERHLGPEIKEFIIDHFRLKFSKNEFKVYIFNI